MSTSKKTFLELVIGLVDPLLSLDRTVYDRVEQEDIKWQNRTSITNLILWPLIFFIFLITIDKNKDNYNYWFLYRVTTISLIFIMAVLSYFFWNRKNLVKIIMYLVSGILATTIAWSMTFGSSFGTKWLVPTIVILVCVSRSFIFPTLFILLLVAINRPFWVTRFAEPIIAVEVATAIIIFLFSHLAKRVWLESKANKFLHDDAVQESIERQIEFDNEIKRFISPVLVKRIEEKTSSGQTLVMALDDVLMRKESTVAIMFTDMRNFSTRSVDIDFVENELVPSSSRIIDGSEDNMGVAKQIGDAVFVYYSVEDPEEALLRATKDAIIGCIQEKERIKELKREVPERYFSITYGEALVGNMASFRHREATVIGSPANLAARMDNLTKEPAFQPLINDGNKILMSQKAKSVIQSFHDNFEFQELDLEQMDLTMKSFPNEKKVYLFPVSEQNLTLINELLSINEIKTIEC